MSKVRVLTVESMLPILNVTTESSTWSKPSEHVEITSYDSNLDELFQEIERHQVAEELIEEQNGGPEGLDWLEENRLRGELGEEIALNYLQSQYSQVKMVSQIASKGYDIEVIHKDTIFGFEIKTSLTVNKFHISYNELQKAYTMNDNYFLFFIFIEELSEDVQSYYGYIIKNPIQELQLDFLELTRMIKSGRAEIIPENFRISMDKDYLESLDMIFLE